MNTFKPREKKNIISGTSLFKKKIEKMPDVSDDIQFPELNENLCKLTPQINTKLDFLDASTKPVIFENKHVDEMLILKSGWVHITKNLSTNKSIITSIEENKNTHNNYQENANEIIENMIQRWNRYKRDYIDLYGEDTYIHFYTTNDYDCDYDQNMIYDDSDQNIIYDE